MQHAQQEFGTVPHSFVFHRGRVGKNVRQLIADMRKVMEPYTARALKVSSVGGSSSACGGGGLAGSCPLPRLKRSPGSGLARGESQRPLCAAGAEE